MCHGFSHQSYAINAVPQRFKKKNITENYICIKQSNAEQMRLDVIPKTQYATMGHGNEATTTTKITTTKQQTKH